MSLLDEARARREQENETRGDAVANFEEIARIASGLLDSEMHADLCCLVMLAVKLMRLNRNPYDRDTQLDICGYLDILADIQEAEREEALDAADKALLDDYFDRPPEAKPEGYGPPQEGGHTKCCNSVCWICR